ncbi:unnamed protein product, partial [Oppiella nova]
MTDCLPVHHYNHKTIVKLPVPSSTERLHLTATDIPVVTYDTLLAMSSPLMTAINHTMGTTRDKEDLDVHHGYY